MERRIAMIALVAGAISAPLAAMAQQPRVWRIGFIWAGSRPASLEASVFQAFPLALRELGYVEGRNLVIEWRFAENEYGRPPGLAAEMARLKVDVIVAEGDPAIRSTRQATATIPIVIALTADPIASGFAKTLARPGGNITGASRNAIDTSPKQLELLRAMVPKLSRVAMLVNPQNPATAVMLKGIHGVAMEMGMTVQAVSARDPADIERGFASMTRESAGALIVPLDGLFISQRQLIARLAVKHRLPSLSLYREHVEAGGLMSYGQDRTDFYRLAATYVDKILKGARPGELPIQQPTRFYFVVNRNTARALGMTVPPELLLRADEVID